jgi:AraC-like DNA-binding protein
MTNDLGAGAETVREEAVLRPTIPIRYLAEMAARARPRSAVTRALGMAELPHGALVLPRFRASIAQIDTFYRVLARGIDDELFGYFARKVPPGAYATLVRLLTGTTHVAATLEACSRFYRLFDRHPYWRFDVDRRRATLTLSPRDRAQAESVFFVHSMLLTPWRTAAWLAGRSLPLDEVWFPPRFQAFAAEARYIFGCEPRFGAGDARLVFRSELARLPVTRTPDEADAFTRTSLRDMLSPALPPTLHRDLRALLSAARPTADLAIPDAARRLGLSRATLARRLAREGTSFQEVKDEVRRDHAIGLLTGTKLPLADIAELLGFSAPSAFQRAFREWTGVSPGRFRSR